jgi:hypothetical protein
MQKTAKNEKEGSALIVVVCLSAIMLMMGAGLLWITKNSAHMAGVIRTEASALAVAEAGIADMMAKMEGPLSNFYYWASATNEDSFGEGRYYVVTRMNTNGRVLIDSTGYVKDGDFRTVVEILGNLVEDYEYALGVNGVILAGGDIVLKSSAMEVNGDIHANGNVTQTAGNPEVNGSISCGGTCNVTPTGTNTVTEGAPDKTVPDLRPFTWWEQMAQSNGIYYGSSVVLPGVDLRPTNGVVYVNGDIEIANSSSLVGTLVASGSITINNRFDQSPFNTNWPCMLAGVNVELLNRNTYWGIIWAANDVINNNRRHIDGGIIAMNNVVSENQMDLTPITAPDWDPLVLTNYSVVVVMGGWIL